MSENTKIEWTDHTFNPWIGCTKVSPGCAHCYAETLMDHRYGKVQWGKGQPRQRTSEANWKLPVKWNRSVICLGCGDAVSTWKTSHFRGGGDQIDCPKCRTNVACRRPKVFCASLADWLDDEVQIEWLADLLSLIHATPNLDWLLLTKRPAHWRPRLALAQRWAVDAAPDFSSPQSDFILSWLDGKPPANVWLGTSVEDQTRADERIPMLLQLPAKVRFLSCEPLLGAVQLQKQSLASEYEGHEPFGINWVICGGESGAKSRPMHPDWARGLRDQCRAAGVPFFFKQWGGVNKKAEGRELDGRTWDALPSNDEICGESRAPRP
jgi:protein gp37